MEFRIGASGLDHEYGQFQIAPPLAVVFAEISTGQLYPLVDHEAVCNSLWYDRVRQKEYCAKVDRMTASVAEHGVIDPVIAHNRRDDGTFEVCIGCHRLLAAKRNGVPAVRCIVNCIEGQSHVPVGRRLRSSEEVLTCFKHPEPFSLRLEGIPNPGALGWYPPGEHGTEGGVFCSPRRHTVDGGAGPSE